MGHIMQNIKQNLFRQFGFILLLFGLLGTSVAVAENNKHPYASLNAQAATEVAQDTLKITLAIEISDESQKSVSEQLAEAMNASVNKAKVNANGVTITSDRYQVWPMNDQEGNISNWRGRGEFSLESKNFEAVSNLAALLDETSVASMSFFVSPQLRAKHEEELLVKAAQSFKDRAQALTKALGYTRYELRSADLSGAGISYDSVPVLMRAAAFSAKAVPVESGTETISVSVNGSVYLFSD